jgi:hypothetical protein
MHVPTTENALINAEKAWRRCNATGVRFVNLALDIGLMFCRIALLSESEHDARRDEAKANSAYQIAVYHATSLLFTIEERNAFNEKKQQLRAHLVDFGFSC